MKRIPVLRRLSVRVSLVILVLETLVLGSLAWFYLGSYGHQIDRRAADGIELPGELMQQGALRYGIVNDLPALHNLTEQDILAAAVLEPDGRIFEGGKSRTADEFQLIQAVYPDFEFSLTIDTKPRLARSNTAAGPRIASLTTLYNQGRHIGWLYLQADATKSLQEKQRLNIGYLTATVGSVLLTWLGIMVLVGRMTGPRLARTLTVLDRARLGEAHVAMAPEGADELARLQQGVNEVLAAVETRTKERDVAIVALAERERDLRTTLDSIGDGVIATDAKGQVTRLNPVAEGLTGWRSEEASGRPLAEVFRIIHAKTRALAADPVERVLATGKVVGLANHTVLVRRDGHESHIADSAAPIRGEDGIVRGVVLVFRDVTHEYELEDRLRHSQKMDAIGQLAGGVAHDFNNMLTAILGGCDLAAAHPLTPIQERALSMARDAALRAADLTRRLLAFARKGQTASAPVDLVAVVRATAEMLTRTVDRQIEVVVEYDGPPIVVQGDIGALQSALLNLGVNARDAMPMGGRLSYGMRMLTSDNRAPRCEIRVTDTGTGISPEVLPRIFEPFFTTKDVGRGTGLGLAVVHTTITDHGGEIAVASLPGRGTIFTITLPLADQSVVAAVLASHAIPGRGTVLVIEDEPALRLLAQSLLDSIGYNVLLAAHGQEGIDLFQARRDLIDVVMLDMVMPGLNGRDTFLKLRAIDPGVQVMVCSGYDRSGAIEELLAEGGVAFLQKPYRIGEISQMLKTMIPDQPPQA